MTTGDGDFIGLRPCRRCVEIVAYKGIDMLDPGFFFSHLVECVPLS